jgi:hypothetical protein
MHSMNAGNPGAPARRYARLSGLLMLSACVVAALIANPAAASLEMPAPPAAMGLLITVGQLDARDGTLAPQYGQLTTASQSLPPESVASLTFHACAAQPHGIMRENGARPAVTAFQGSPFPAGVATVLAGCAPCCFATGACPGAPPGFTPRC